MISLKSMRLIAAVFLSLLLLAPRALAQEATPSSSLFEPQLTQKVDYTLPYPGILPDNPLYSIKMLRDKIILFLISDPYKKAKFNLMQADKRLQAGVYLLEQQRKKEELALSTMDKGENYFFQSLEQVTQMKQKGQDVGSLLGDLKSSSAKHHEVLTELLQEYPAQKSHFQKLLERVEGFQQTISNLEKK